MKGVNTDDEFSVRCNMYYIKKEQRLKRNCKFCNQPISSFSPYCMISFSQLLTYGAAIRALFVPDKDGNKEDVVLGFDDMDGYQVSETGKRHFIFDA